MEVVRHGKYKSAVEPYLANKMSAENREQITAFLQSIWNELLADISESRAISTDKLNDIADKLLGRNASLATQNNLVDAAVYWDEYEQRLKQAVGIDSDESLETISIQDYIATGKGRILTKGTDKIAVIYAQGEIQYGKGNEDIIGQDLMIEALKKVRKDSKVKAVVLRVNSPGGSALASELIWRELALTKEKLPLVVSMGDVAASGGYYLACNADKIIAEPTTITGSIGVFGVLPNASKLANNIGVNAEQVSTNQGATYSIFEPMSPAFRSVTKEGVEQVYDTFLKRVSDGRNMTVEAVDKVAQGRVWAGVEALEAGLVDGLGGLEEAIAQAAKLADISTYKIRSYPRYRVAIQDKLNSFPFLRSKEDILQETLGEEAHQLYSRVRSFSRVKGVQARMPFALEIR
jgi:protease-4